MSACILGSGRPNRQIKFSIYLKMSNLILCNYFGLLLMEEEKISMTLIKTATYGKYKPVKEQKREFLAN